MQLRLPAQCKQKREALRCQFWEMSRGMDPKRGQHEEDYDNDKPLDSGDSGDSPNQSLPPQQGEFYPDGMKTSGLGMERSIDRATAKSLAASGRSRSCLLETQLRDMKVLKRGGHPFVIVSDKY